MLNCRAQLVDDFCIFSFGSVFCQRKLVDDLSGCAKRRAQLVDDLERGRLCFVLTSQLRTIFIQ